MPWESTGEDMSLSDEDEFTRDLNSSALVTKSKPEPKPVQKPIEPAPVVKINGHSKSNGSVSMEVQQTLDGGVQSSVSGAR